MTSLQGRFSCNAQPEARELPGRFKPGVRVGLYGLASETIASTFSEADRRKMTRVTDSLDEEGASERHDG
jgi:hypothetical protein